MPSRSSDGVSESHAIRATWMRGGSSKGLFFAAEDLPPGLMQRPSLRDALLLRIVGSPDPHGRQIDGIGGATMATSKIVIVSRSLREDCDVEVLFGAVSIARSTIDWSGDCGHLSAAIGPFAIQRGWVSPRDVDPARIGSTTVRVWQQSLGKRIVAHVPTRGGHVIETGTFHDDGVPFGSAEIHLEFIDPTDAEGPGLLPTGSCSDLLHVPDLEDLLPASNGHRAGTLRVTMIDAGEPVVFVRADALKLSGRELPDAVNRDTKLLARLEAIRGRAVILMGLGRAVDEETRRRIARTNIAFVAAPVAYRSSAGLDIDKTAADVVARIVSTGTLHPAFTHSGSIALAAAAALPGTVVSEVARTLPGVPTRIGHASGVFAVGAVVEKRGEDWHVERAVMSRSARRLMEGTVFAPRAD